MLLYLEAVFIYFFKYKNLKSRKNDIFFCFPPYTASRGRDTEYMMAKLKIKVTGEMLG